jgi:anti-sigma B factor antagonist
MSDATHLDDQPVGGQIDAVTLETPGPQSDLPLLRWQAAVAALAAARRLNPLTFDPDLLDEVTEAKVAYVQSLVGDDAGSDAFLDAFLLRQAGPSIDDLLPTQTRRGLTPVPLADDLIPASGPATSSQLLVGGWTVLPISGEVDALTAPDLRRAIIDQLETTDALVIDLTAVTFLDSSGLSVLVETMKRLENVGGRLKLVITSPQVARVLRVTNLDHVFDIALTLATATAVPPTAV